MLISSCSDISGNWSGLIWVKCWEWVIESLQSSSERLEKFLTLVADCSLLFLSMTMCAAKERVLRIIPDRNGEDLP